MNMGKRIAEEFLKQPRLVQELWFEWLYKSTLDHNNDAGMFAITYGFDTENCKSPIEQIFMFAFDTLYFMGGRDTFFEGMYLENQYLIEHENKKYYADFLLHHDFADIEKSKALVIECDGHDFHEKTKTQVAKDNERSLDIKTEGYDIIRFSGSQIYNDPIGCAKKAIDYFKTITVLVEGGGYSDGNI